MRASGILLPIFSLPSESDIGDIYQSAHKFIDLLSQAGQRYWQILPVHPANEDNCPYQPRSCFAGDPLFISVQKLQEQNLLEGERAAALAEKLRVEISQMGSRIEYKRIRPIKYAILHEAYEQFAGEKKQGLSSRAYQSFCDGEKNWLEDYAHYAALSNREDEIDFHKWTQYEFFSQWDVLRSYAHSKGVQIIGDVPYYAARESADCWSHPELFMLGRDGEEAFVAGAPPDGFTAEGQCWGNPVYNWEAHKKQGFQWWIDRLRHQFRMFDVVRIDHMRGFESFYMIPAASGDPKEGHWEKGPGLAFFEAVRQQLDSAAFIAEDLGYLTQEVRDMLEATGFPGMKILQFAFDTSEENVYLPFNYDTDNSVIYTGTHDNDTTLGWYRKAEDWKRRFVTWYLKEKSDLPQWRKDELTGQNTGSEEEFDEKTATIGLLEMAQAARCHTCILPVQDLLLLDSDARINVPGKAEGNWNWKLTEEMAQRCLCQELPGTQETLAAMSRRYGR